MSKKGIVLYLHVHQPWRVRQYSVFDTAERHDYFNELSWDTDRNNERVMRKVADKSYRPMCVLLEKLLRNNPDFKVSLSITGTFLEQAQLWTPDVLDSFKRLVATGQVEILGETYYHSLAFFYDKQEFERQIDMHRAKIREIFDVDTAVLRNTELAYNNELGKWADDHGYSGVLAEGWDAILGWKSPNYVYSPVGASNAKLLLKNYKLSDDLAFRFSDRSWSEWPLDVDKYNGWMQESAASGDIVNLFMDFETFGEHQWADTGIFSFMEGFVSKWLADDNHTFYTVSEALSAHESAGEIDVPHTVTWADTERDLSAWLGNSMQQEALRHVYAMTDDVVRIDDSELLADWRKIQASDLVYYMCTKRHNDGSVHAYFSPYDSPYDAFLYYMNAMRDIRYRVMEHSGSRSL